MWLLFDGGFVSIVAHRERKDRLLCRARIFEDLEKFRSLAGAKRVPILETPDADYRFRIVVTRAAVQRATAKIVERLDYPNFKDRIAETRQGYERRALYHDVWETLHKLQDPPEPYTEPVHYDRLAALLRKLEANAEDAWLSLYKIAHDDGVIFKDFAWPKYKDRLEREHFVPKDVATADLEKCRKILTIIVRQDRFSDGSLAGHVASGLAPALVRRIIELTEKGPKNAS